MIELDEENEWIWDSIKNWDTKELLILQLQIAERISYYDEDLKEIFNLHKRNK
jgi:hypothetical protein